MKNYIIYQMALRSFTPEGTLNAAKDLLPHVASLNVDVVYLCPVFKADDDPDEMTWSPRQRASGTLNPKNPYKIVDYYNVDSEYGTNQDLKDFVEEAHKLGLKVMFDLVYLHCGKNAIFIKDNPDFVLRNEDGSTLIGETWPFARLNFDNDQLRKYLIENMKMFVTEYKVDGFRCDVGDGVPLDFWADAFSEIKKINPELIALNEGVLSHYVEDVFDFCYGFDFSKKIKEIFADKASAAELKAFHAMEMEKYGDNISKIQRTLDNHDVASDSGIMRHEITMTSAGVEAALVITNTYDGFPYIWNGYEFCDNAENSMFSNRLHGRRSAINWSRSYTEAGKRRLDFVRRIHKIRHECDEIAYGKTEWIDNSCPEKIISYLKNYSNKKAIIIVNTKNEDVTFSVKANIDKNNIYISSGVKFIDGSIKIAPYGYIIAKVVD